MKFFIFVLFSFIFTYASAHAQWVQIPAPGTPSVTIVANDAALYAATADTRPDSNAELFYRSTDDGNTWILATTHPLHSYATKILALDTELIVNMYEGGLYRLPMGDSVWHFMANTLGEPRVDALSLYGPYLFVGGSVAPSARSSDGGNTWMIMDSSRGLPSAVSEYGFSGGFLFAAGHGLFRSSDSGSSWIEIDNGITDPDIFRVVSAGSNLYVSASQAQVVLSTDNGEHWTQKPLSTLGIVYSIVAWGDTVVVGSEFRGASFSTDRGTHWTEVNDGFHGIPPVSGLLLHHGYLFARTNNNGLWRRSVRELVTSILSTSTMASSASMLGVSYPNPTATETTVPLTLMERTLVVGKLYSTAGSELRTVVNEVLDPGTHEFHVRTDDLSAGAYVLQTQFGVHHDSRLLIVK